MVHKRIAKAVAVVAFFFIVATAAKAGPPFQTDDPEPVDFRHYEFYTFGAMDGTGVEIDTLGPALEFNWGILPNTQFHIVFPAAAIFPYNNARYSGAGVGGRAWGVGDTEIGVKLRYVKETKYRPMIGTFTMIEVPTGDSANGLGVGKVWWRLPVWVQKSWGPWTTYGGVGETIIPQTGFNNFTFGGWLLQRDIGKRLTLGTEVFSHGNEGRLTTQPGAATLVDFGGYYYFRNPGFQLLFCYGHSVAGLAETYAYLGLYWTWGNSKDEKKAGESAFNPMHSPEIPGIM
ncbi:MAG TPA: hypothetical protein VKT50_09350 [Candidatus Acidoferrales bacterium]|nr:hypothetical protein [Candidatus Acidoferrales bacterium]